MGVAPAVARRDAHAAGTGGEDVVSPRGCERREGGARQVFQALRLHQDRE